MKIHKSWTLFNYLSAAKRKDPLYGSLDYVAADLILEDGRYNDFKTFIDEVYEKIYNLIF